jgi:hypothetical protein
MRFHWQNLKERDRSITRRRTEWLAGRCWWGPWRLEWHIPAWKSCAIELDFNDGDSSDEIQIHIGLWLFAFWLSCEGLPIPVGHWFTATWDKQDPTRTVFSRDGRRMGLSFYGGRLRLDFWARTMEWRSSDPWWIKGVRLDFADLLLGQRKHEHEILSDWKSVVIPMPEGCYESRMREERRTWRRTRWPWWPFKIVQEYLEIDIPGGIPHEGKGENSYDCDEDGLWGCSSSSWSVEKAVGHVVEVCLKDRKNYGGSFIHRGRGPVMAAKREALR